MSEARVLSLVARYPHRAALTRRARDSSVFAALRRLEACGFVRRRDDAYRLTSRGREELAWAVALLRLGA